MLVTWYRSPLYHRARPTASIPSPASRRKAMTSSPPCALREISPSRSGACRQGPVACSIYAWRKAARPPPSARRTRTWNTIIPIHPVRSRSSSSRRPPEITSYLAVGADGNMSLGDGQSPWRHLKMAQRRGRVEIRSDPLRRCVRLRAGGARSGGRGRLRPAGRPRRRIPSGPPWTPWTRAPPGPTYSSTARRPRALPEREAAGGLLGEGPAKLQDVTDPAGSGGEALSPRRRQGCGGGRRLHAVPHIQERAPHGGGGADPRSAVTADRAWLPGWTPCPTRHR